MAHRRVRNRSAIAREAPRRIARQTGPPGTPLRVSHRTTRGAAGYKSAARNARIQKQILEAATKIKVRSIKASKMFGSQNRNQRSQSRAGNWGRPTS
jgi:hypothetical protein